MSLRTSALSKGERLLIDRRRRGETQVDAGRRFGITTFRYREWELDLDPKAPTVKPGRLTDLEVCYLRRRRAKHTLPQLADLMGISRFWLNQMERGSANPERLIAYWRSA